MSMTPTLAQLRAVHAVAEERSFSRAAARMLVAQSSLSRAVAEVERMCGVRLFERTTRHVAPTADGLAFLGVAERVLLAYDEGLAHFAGYLEGSAGVVRVATLPSLAATLLPQVVERFRATRPGVGVEVEDVLAVQVVSAVRAGRVDLALTAAVTPTGEAPTAVDGLRFEPVAADVFACLVAPDHHLAARARMAWTDFSQEAFVSFDEASSVRAISDAVLAARGVEPVRRITARNVASVAGLCAAGLGVTAAPGLVVPLMSFAGLRRVPLVDPVVRRHIGVLTDPRRPTTPAAAALLEVLRELADHGAPLPEDASWAGAG